MSKNHQHHYSSELTWTGNLGTGTASYTSYSRNHELRGPEKPTILGSSDPAFRGDATRYNPEDLLVSSLSACHLLVYLHLAATAGVVVIEYTDSAEGTMVEEGDGGHFVEVVLRPSLVIQDSSKAELATELHHKAHDLCFIAQSVNFPVRCEPKIVTATKP